MAMVLLVVHGSEDEEEEERDVEAEVLVKKDRKMSSRCSRLG